jgi:hypothetical protein
MPKRALVRYTLDRRVYAANVRRLGEGAFFAEFDDGERLFAKRENGALVAWPAREGAMGALVAAALTECPRSPRRGARRKRRRAVAGSS